MERIIGREDEIRILNDCTESAVPEFAVIYGRRRIGKTYLVRNHFGDKFSFCATGVFEKNKEQFSAFYESLKEYGDCEGKCPADWFEAFGRLKNLLIADDVYKDALSGKKIIFLDEVPWMSTTNSDFKAALDYFWNSWASTQNDILLIACGSATSWILNNLLYDKGGFFIV